jgi:hypothetical protein
MEAPITMGINHKPAPELLVPYWIDGLGSWWESALYSEAERAALAYCDTLTEGNRLGFTHLRLAAPTASMSQVPARCCRDGSGR